MPKKLKKTCGSLTRYKPGLEASRFYNVRLIASLFDNIKAIVYVADPETGVILYANKALQEMFGRSLVGGVCYRELQHRNSPCPFCTNKLILAEQGGPYQWEYHNPLLQRDFLVTDKTIKWADGRDVRFEYAVDITEHKRLEEQLRYLNLHDPLTGAYNRAYLKRKCVASKTGAAARRELSSVTLMA